LTLLELEASTVFEVSKRSGINRSSAYVVLETLQKKGYVGISDDKKVRQYVAASPETLLQAARIAARKQEEIRDNIQIILPELKGLQKSKKRRATLKVFEGENGARELYQSIFSSKASELRTIANPYNIFKRVPDFVKANDDERSRRGIKMFAIMPAKKEVIELVKNFPPQNPVEYCFIPEDKFKFSSDLGIYGDNVSFVSPEDNFGFVIESKDIAEMLRNTFDLAWEESKRLNIKIKNKKAKNFTKF